MRDVSHKDFISSKHDWSCHAIVQSLIQEVTIKSWNEIPRPNPLEDFSKNNNNKRITHTHTHTLANII